MRCYAPDPAGGANSAPPDILAGFCGEQKEEGRERERSGEKGIGSEREKKGRKGEGYNRKGGKGGREEFCE